MQPLHFFFFYSSQWISLSTFKTHIFDGVEEWPTHLFYLTGNGVCGWQGSLEENEYYQQLKRGNHPAKMLAVAENWLRTEMNEKRRVHIHEEALGELAHAMDPTDRQGGYASGRGLPITLTR